MVQVFLVGLGKSKCIEISSETSALDLTALISKEIRVPSESFYLSMLGGAKPINSGCFDDYEPFDGCSIKINIRIRGGIDFQHREGSKIGSGGLLSESQAAIERRERLRKLALETIDISKDPYFMRNHLGSYECKLCLTLHNNEGNYLAHTQGKRHQVLAEIMQHKFLSLFSSRLLLLVSSLIWPEEQPWKRETHHQNH